jgi:hypothetical protein
MLEIELVPVEKDARKGLWLLTLGKRRIVLSDPRRMEVTSFDAAGAEERFKLPSFWFSIKHLGVVTDKGEVLWFRPDKEAVRGVRTYLDQSLGARGPEAIRTQRLRGWLYLLGGVGLFVGGVVFIIVREKMAEEREIPRAARRFFFLPLLLGLMAVARGVVLLRQCARAARYADTEQDES